MVTIEKLSVETDPVEFENLLKLFCMKRAKILQLFYKQITRSKVKQSLEHLKQLWGIKKELNDLSLLAAPQVASSKKLFNKLWRAQVKAFRLTELEQHAKADAFTDKQICNSSQRPLYKQEHQRKNDNIKEVESDSFCDVFPQQNLGIEIFNSANQNLTVKIENLSAIEERSDEMSIRLCTKDLTRKYELVASSICGSKVETSVQQQKGKKTPMNKAPSDTRVLSCCASDTQDNCNIF